MSPGAGAGAEEVRRARPLIVTEDLALLDDLLRLCAAAGAEPEVHHTVPERGTGWTDPPLVLVGDDAAAAAAEPPAGRACSSSAGMPTTPTCGGAASRSAPTAC